MTYDGSVATRNANEQIMNGESAGSLAQFGATIT